MDAPDCFSFHLRRVRLADVPRAVFGRRMAPGLKHAESFFTMRLGAPVLSARRYGILDVATLLWWRDESSVEQYLASPEGRALADGWHVKLKLYRRWGHIAELADAVACADAAAPARPVVAITLARLKLRETLRFTRFGKPVERQVRDHPGNTLAFAAIRPVHTFCTFSVWRDEAAMVGMVQGRHDERDGPSHKLAMRERTRRDFHREFMTMRLVPLAEVGTWRGGAGFTRPLLAAPSPPSGPAVPEHQERG